MTSSSASRSSPVRRPTVIACASVAQLTAVTPCESTLTAWPWPASPAWTIFSPITSNSGRARSTSASAPPHMIVSVPASAFGEEPVTGASTNAWPRAGDRLGQRARGGGRDRGHVDEQRRRRALRRARRPRRAASPRPAAPSTTIVITTSERSATSRGRPATCPPCSAAHCLGPLARAVEDRQLVAGLGEVGRLARAHDAQSDEADRCHAPCPPPPGVSIRSRWPAPQATGRLRRQLLAVEQVAPARAGLAAVGAGRRVAAALGEQRVAHRRERLELAHDPVAAAVLAVAAGAAPQRVAHDAQRELQLERLDRRVERVRHRDVHAARAVGVRAGALAAAERLVVGEVVGAEREVVHRALAERAAERGEHEVGDARRGLDVARHHRGRAAGVEQAALGRA